MKRIIIYGAGDYCTSVVSVLSKDYDIIGIADKDRKKQGNQIAGQYQVLSVEEMLNMDYDCIVVSVKNHYRYIREELKDKNIPESKIKHYSEIYSAIEPANMINADYDIEKSRKTYSIFQNSIFYEKVYGVVQRSNKRKMDIAFLVPAPIRASGGHRNMYRIIYYLNKKGYGVTVYYTGCVIRADIVKWQVSKWFYEMGDIPFICYDGSMGKHDICIATWWETVYAMLDHQQNFNYLFHFVQDNEASFYPMCSYAILAENVYKQNLMYICSGPWMKTFLQRKYNAKAECFQFPVDRKIYHVNAGRTKENKNIIFFAKPEMPRRCYELGIAALAEVYRRMPEIEIILFGSEKVGDVPFPVTKMGILPTLANLADLYRNADLGLVFSPTNPSLVPYEMMACGCPVADMNLDYALSKYGDDENNVFLLDTRPQHMGEQICEALQNEELLRQKREHGFLWVKKEFPSEEEMGERVERILLDEIT